MDFKSTVDIIINDIKELEHIVDDFKNYPDVPSLQIRIAKSKCRNAIEILEIIKEEGQERVTISKEEEKKEPIIEEKPQKEIATEQTNDVTEKSNDIIIESSSHNFTDDILDIFNDSDGNETAVPSEPVEVQDAHTISEPPKEKETVTVETPNIKNKKTQETTIIAEQFNQNANWINEAMGSNSKPELSKGKKVTDLFDSIGISDKFLYIKEIFNGDSALYNETITKINNTNTFDEAYDIIVKHVDDEKNETFKSLIELIKRKF
ncbi:MAG: hypothetical protein J6W61_05355 [Bacteroidales bacterium]|nr:hypothetical protein [Bacteroidales bacterium]MBP5709174.1 hypothetical protein [Bacteroidales bacterium]